MDDKVKKLIGRLPDVEAQLGDPDVFSDQTKYRELSQQHSYLSDLKVVYDKLSKARKELEENKGLLKEEEDEDFRKVLEEEIPLLEESVHRLETQLADLLVPPDPRDHANTIVEVRAGTGGDEAALFVGDCVRMYRLYADREGWKVEKLSSTPSEVGGFKEYVMVLSGKNVFRKMQHEAGTHRVQRVPETETQGRVHTSAVTVAVLQEPGEEEDVKVEEKDLRIDTYRASGAGGQHVNTTDSAVRLTHIPSGIVVYCQEEKSQHKNREKAMRLLKARIAEVEREKKEKEMASTRASQVGTGDRSERIRTYNFSQNRVTDHRINLTLYKLTEVIQGDLEEITSPLVAHFYQKQLEAVGDES